MKTGEYILFPVQQANGEIYYYVSDYSEALGGNNGLDVYKGYQCKLKLKENLQNLQCCWVNAEDVVIDETRPVVIKFYNNNQKPSPYQFYSSEIAVLNTEDRDLLLMDFIDGFHIYPDAKENNELRKLSFFEVVDISWQMILGLNQLHYNNMSGNSIVHGDIKGENIKIRMRQEETGSGEKYKIDVFYLDFDYAKPIKKTRQISQGTLEHLAPEILEGYYSEASDFFALSPLLLSLFGAENPLREIIEYRNRNLKTIEKDLIKNFHRIGLNTEGLFEHFQNKPEQLICDLVKKIILQMGAKNKDDRPQPEAILEFFTALRQYCLDKGSDQDKAIYRLRLFIAAGDESWLNDEKSRSLFMDQEEHLQERLVLLMTAGQAARLYASLSQEEKAALLGGQLRKQAAHHLAHKTLALKKSSFFSLQQPHLKKDLNWLLRCYEEKDGDEFYSVPKEKIRKKLLNCKDKTLRLLIAVVADGLEQSLKEKPDQQNRL